VIPDKAKNSQVYESAVYDFQILKNHSPADTIQFFLQTGGVCAPGKPPCFAVFVFMPCNFSFKRGELVTVEKLPGPDVRPRFLRALFPDQQPRPEG
jgi:hypothetical protein